MTTLALPHKNFSSWITFIYASLFGCGLIAVCSLIKVPFYPISFTCHTLAISLLGITQSPLQAVGSVLCYLLCASLGLPLLSGHANPLWILGKSGGYLISYPLAVYLIATLSSRFSKTYALFLSQYVIYLFGFLWLLPFVGPYTAFTKGVLIFIPTDMLKNWIALQLTKESFA